MNYLLLISLFISLAITPSYSQQTQRTIGDCTVFTIPFKRKPIFLFRQGSLPIPLFTINPKTNRPALTELPTICYDHQADYHCIMLAKPGVPLVVNDSYLDSLFSTRTNPIAQMYSDTYKAHNYLDYYVDQTNEVLQFVLSQPWADAKRVVLTGGSEGYHVAIKTAYTNKRVTHLIAFSGGLQGRFQSIIRQERVKGYTGEYTQQEAQEKVEALQQQWLAICQDSLNVTPPWGDPNRTTYSFSHNHNLDYLLTLEIPICILYGTADVGSVDNDLLPLEFARRGKNNLTVKAYPNHDHTFYRLAYDPTGKVTDKVYNGEAVQKDYFQWLETH